MKDDNKCIEIDFTEKFKDLIFDDIPRVQLPIVFPEVYRENFIHPEDGFAYKYCMSPEEQEKVRKTRKKTLKCENK